MNIPTAKQALEQSALVVEATVEDIDSRSVEVGEGASPWQLDDVSIRVKRVWKGTDAPYLEFSSGSSSCDFRFEEGETYVIFFETAGSRFVATKCMPTMKVAQATSTIDQLGPARITKPIIWWDRVRAFFRRLHRHADL